MKYLLLSIISCSSLFAFSQKRSNSEKFPSYFGVGAYVIFPNNFQDSKTLTITDTSSVSTITQGVGRSFGAYLRRQYTDRFSIETGLFYSTRKFNIDMSVPDSNLRASTSLTFTTFDIPLNGMVLLKMTDKIYANAGFGVSMTYKPSNVGVISNPEGKHQFAHAGLIRNKFAFNINGHIGFELRTEEDGFIYIGGVARVPLTELFIFQSKYQYEDNSVINNAKFADGWLGLEIKYYFHNVKNKGAQPKQGPIVQ